MTNEKRITKIQIANPTPYKAHGPRGKCFAVDVLYHLEDGTTQAAHISSERKKNLPAAIQRQIDNAASGAMKAIYHGAEYFGTSTSYTLGGSQNGRGFSLVPVVPETAPAEDPPEVAAALATLQPFIGRAQLAAVRDGLRGEEKQFFIDKMNELAAIVTGMPKTYEQDGKGDDAIVSLHYFTGGGNWWITEKDAETPDEPGQHQAFGLANCFGGPDDQDAELGYISIVELLAAGAELDFHFRPRTLRELKAPTPKQPLPAPALPPPPFICGACHNAAKEHLHTGWCYTCATAGGSPAFTPATPAAAAAAFIDAL